MQQQTKIKKPTVNRQIAWTHLNSKPGQTLVALLGGLLAIDHLQSRSQIDAATDVDSALLADDLPPQAYSDPGFLEFLRSPEQ